MADKHLAGEGRGLLAALGCVAIGIAVFWLLDRVANVDDAGAAFIALLVCAILVYALASGRLQEFSAPGGWAAKFRDAVTDAVEGTRLDETLQADGTAMALKRSPGQIPEQVARMERGKPAILRLQMGHSGYMASVVEDYLDAMYEAGVRPVLVIVDSNRRFLASVCGEPLRRILADVQMRQTFLNAIELSDRAALERIRALTFESLAKGVNNRSALETMHKLGVASMVLVDEERKPMGIVERESLVTKLVLKLATSS